ncbi:MAG: hypothetical protein ACNYWM_01825 [Methanosarcinales archaeon]
MCSKTYPIIGHRPRTITELKKIRADLDLLTNLYSKLVEKLIPEEEPEDLKAIHSIDKIASESELLTVFDA